MEFSIRLAHIISTRTDWPERGAITRIADATGLDRHAVGDLYRNRSKTISRQTLAVICDFLVREKIVRADEVPGVLFGREFGEFWHIVSAPRHMDICVGERTNDDDAWVVAADAHLIGKLQHAIALHEQAWVELDKDYTPSPDDADETAPAVKSPPTCGPIPGGPRTVVHRFIPAPPSTDHTAATMKAVKALHKSLVAGYVPDRALACVGSVKSNPLIEVAVCDVCGIKPFAPHLVKPERQVPFYMRYRGVESDPVSSFGGQDPPGKGRRGPGFYYIGKKGKWQRAAWGEKSEPAIIFYVKDKTTGRMLLVLGGFTSVGTRLLARALARLTVDDLTPTYNTDLHAAGGLILQFTVPNDRSEFASHGHSAAISEISGAALGACLVKKDANLDDEAA